MTHFRNERRPQKGTNETQHGKSRSPNREFLTTVVVKMTVGELAER